MKKLIVGNWKMNQSLSEIDLFFKESSSTISHEAWIAPQFIHLSYCLQTKNSTSIKIGAQNCSAYKSGAYTGEVSAQALKDLGAHFVIIGHSERRQIFHETNAELNQKIKQALSADLKVIYCVGETLEERKNNQTLAVIKKQITEGLVDVTNSLIIAYEPVWAIGTGLSATPEQAEEVHAYIRTFVRDPILYGGSVKPENIKDLFQQKNIDGALVGGASLKSSDFLKLCGA
jgi:triosephosphate isomerase